MGCSKLQHYLGMLIWEGLYLAQCQLIENWSKNSYKAYLWCVKALRKIFSKQKFQKALNHILKILIKKIRVKMALYIFIMTMKRNCWVSSIKNQNPLDHLVKFILLIAKKWNKKKFRIVSVFLNQFIMKI